MALRLVSNDRIKIELEDNDWLEVKEDMSRRDFNRIIATLPVTREGLDTDAIDLEAATGFSEALFDVFVTGWSLEGVEPNVENYQRLSRESSQTIDTALSEHFNKMTVSDEDATKSA